MNAYVETESLDFNDNDGGFAEIHNWRSPIELRERKNTMKEI